MGDWESIFQKNGRVFLQPQEDMADIIEILKKHDIRRVLDLGCGSGHHTLLFAKHGFEVHSTYISKTDL